MIEPARVMSPAEVSPVKLLIAERLDAVARAPLDEDEAAREAFAPALIHQAPAVAFVHNHPSGDPAPSGEDQRMQMLLEEAAHTLGVRVIDHLVIAETGFHSALQGRCPPVSLVPREGVG